MKILIAVPTFENILPETFKSIYDLYVDDNIVDFQFVRGYDCAKARNAIAQKALDGGWDYVLMVDSDIVLPPETLVWFLEKPVDVCFGLYPHKNTKDGEAEIFKLGTIDYSRRFKFSELSGDRIRIKGAGCGCAFVKTDIFKRLKYPWFKFVAYPNCTFLSEDLYFCSEASNLGIDIWADTRIRCGHLAKHFQYE